MGCDIHFARMSRMGEESLPGGLRIAEHSAQLVGCIE